MNENEKKKFSDNFRNPNGNYHIPTWLIVVGFILNWVLGVALLIARISEDRNNEAGAQGEFVDASYTEVPGSSGQAEGQNHAGDSGSFTQSKQVYKSSSKNKKKKKKNIVNARFWGILGGITLLCGVSDLPDNIQYLVWCIQNKNSISYAIEETVGNVMWIAAGIIMLVIMAVMRSNDRKRRKIQAIVGNAENISISEIAEALPASFGKTERLLESCINKGMFGEKAYLDMRSECLVIKGPAPASKKARQEAEAAARAEELAQEAAAQNMDEYEKILKELRDLNDKIPGEEMSAKISRLEELTAKIFKLAKEQPEKLGTMRKFMDYYLPTSLKLLSRYEKLDSQGIEGTNISESKKQIEQTMDTMITAFEKQLDKMFLSESIDISADIAAMQYLMRADVLIENKEFAGIDGIKVEK